MSVQVILREPIDNLGSRGDIVKVANGYARNYLLPRKLALPVTESNQRRVSRERVVADARDAAEKEAAEAFASRLSQAICIIGRRVGQTNTMYGSVTNGDVAASLAAQSFEVDRRKILLVDPIKQLGAHTVRIRVHRQVTTEVTVHVVEEGKENDPIVPVAAPSAEPVDAAEPVDTTEPDTTDG
jgi:large subunit ribosomal protein L9